MLAYNELSEIKKYRVGDIIGSYLIEMLKKEGVELDLAPKLEDGLSKLYHKRVDLWISVGLTAYFMVENKYPKMLNDLAYMEKPIVGNSVDLNFMKNHKDYKKVKKQFLKGFKIIQKNGTYKEILSRYFGKNIPKYILAK